jgi:hypothetical protein
VVFGGGAGEWVGGKKSAIEDGACFTASLKGERYLYAGAMGRRQRESEFQNLSDEEVARRARDRSLPVVERRRYQREEKFRGLRGKRKRG